MTPARHWDEVYLARHPDELGWFEPVPSTLSLVHAHSTPDDGVIDVGGGASLLTASLWAAGYRDLTVLDVSSSALVQGQQRMGPDASSVRWISCDITTYPPDRVWQVWHDRAVFHFLVERTDREAYVRVAAQAVAPGGVAIVATFGPEGPERCAGLPVERYDVEGLAAQFRPLFELEHGGPLLPVTGTGDQRPFVVVVLRRR